MLSILEKKQYFCTTYSFKKRKKRELSQKQDDDSQ